MTGAGPLAAAAMLALAAGTAAAAELSPQMQEGIAGARYVARYSPAERARAAQAALQLSSPPALGRPLSLTPDAPYSDGARLSFWKPAFLLGTADGGEAGINFWGLRNEGHVNLSSAPGPKSHLLDCRLLSQAGAAYRVYAGPGSAPIAQGELSLSQGHALLVVAGAEAGAVVSVEIWPSPVDAVLGFLGCDVSEIG